MAAYRRAASPNPFFAVRSWIWLASLAWNSGTTSGPNSFRPFHTRKSDLELYVHQPTRDYTGGSLMAKGFVSITVERCKGCGFCVEFCPTRVLALSSAYNSKGYHPPHVVSAEKCSGCDLCGMYCPDFAIFGARYAR